MENIAWAKPSAILVSRPCSSTIFSIVHERKQHINWFKKKKRKSVIAMGKEWQCCC